MGRAPATSALLPPVPGAPGRAPSTGRKARPAGGKAVEQGEDPLSPLNQGLRFHSLLSHHSLRPSTVRSSPLGTGDGAGHLTDPQFTRGSTEGHAYMAKHLHSQGTFAQVPKPPCSTRLPPALGPPRAAGRGACPRPTQRCRPLVFPGEAGGRLGGALSCAPGGTQTAGRSPESASPESQSTAATIFPRPDQATRCAHPWWRAAPARADHRVALHSGVWIPWKAGRPRTGGKRQALPWRSGGSCFPLDSDSGKEKRQP